MVTKATPLSTAEIGAQMETINTGLYLGPFLPLLTQANTFTCPPWVSTTMVGCTALATTAAIGRQVLTHGATATRTTCSSTDTASTCSTTAAAPMGSGSAGSSSPKSPTPNLPEPTVTDRREVKGRAPNGIKEGERH